MSGDLTEREHYAKMVCLFLAEGLRTSKISLKRAVEIAEKVLVHANALHSESDYLALVKELSKDFEELIPLEKQILKQRQAGERRFLDALVKEYATSILPADSMEALSVLEEAAKGDATLAKLRKKFPLFEKFLQTHAEYRIPH